MLMKTNMIKINERWFKWMQTSIFMDFKTWYC
jgi:hypothetical protein